MHEMHLNQEPFADISAGTKNIEIRLDDLKRRNVHIGDTIRFTLRSEPKQTVLVRVINKKHQKHLGAPRLLDDMRILGKYSAKARIYLRILMLS